MSLIIRTAVLAALAVLLLLPGQAMADSIALIRDNNVWLVSPDGARQRQVTTDGTDSRPYGYPSQADDGTILTEIDRCFAPSGGEGHRGRSMMMPLQQR
jgi:hypothetical protein